MKRNVVFATLLVLLFAAVAVVFLYINSLSFKVQKALRDKDCTVSVAAIYGDKIWTYNDKKVPLMSVFKVFITAKTLKKLETTKESLDKIFIIKEEDVDKNTYTPMLNDYSKFPFQISVKELLEYLITKSDNNACDILLEYTGGAGALEDFLQGLGFYDIEISVNEAQMWAEIQNEYKNRAKPAVVIKFIKAVIEGDLLSLEHKTFLKNTMLKTVTGEDKIKAGLPKGAVFGHKTGSSSRKPDGVKIADNDTGFVILPDGKILYIGVFVTESKMSNKENAALIARVSKIIYNHFVK